jgi:hypothetical protein
VESLSAELLFGMSPDGFDQKEQKEKPSDWMVFFLAPRAGLELQTAVFCANKVQSTLQNIVVSIAHTFASDTPCFRL